MSIIPIYTLCAMYGALVMMLSYLVPLFEQLWKIDDFHKAMISQTIFIGMIFGSLIGGYLGDKKGRKIVLQSSFIIITTFAFLSSLS